MSKKKSGAKDDMVSQPKHQVFSITITRKQIADAYNEMPRFANADSPTELDLCHLRMLLPGDCEMISLAWLRNKVVTCRKANELKKKKGGDENCIDHQRASHANGEKASLF